MFWNVKSKEVNNMNEKEMEERLEVLYRQLAARTKNLDNSENKNIRSEIKKLHHELDEIEKNKNKLSTKGEEPAQHILPQWSATGKKVSKMKIKKRRRPGGSGNIEPMGM